MRIAAIILAALMMPGCLGVLTTGLDVTVENQSDERVSGTLTLTQANETVTTRAFELDAGGVLKLNDITRKDGRYVLNVTLEDGRGGEGSVVAGGAYGTPQVKIGRTQILVFQKEDIPPRSL